MSDILMQRLSEMPSSLNDAMRTMDMAKEEIERLQEVKRRSLVIADERAIEAVKARAENERLQTELSHASQWREAYTKEIDRLRALLTKANDELERISVPEDGVDAFCAEIAKVLGVEPLHQQGRDTTKENADG